MRYYCPKNLENSITQSNLKNSSPETKISRKLPGNSFLGVVKLYCQLGNVVPIPSVHRGSKTRPLLLWNGCCRQTRRVSPWMPRSHRRYLKADRTDLVTIVFENTELTTSRNILWNYTFVLIISKDSGKFCQIMTKVFDYISKLCGETITFCFPLHGAQLRIESQINTIEAHSGIFSQGIHI